MIKNFALLDKNWNVIGTMSFPDNLEFKTPHHKPNIELLNGEKASVGMAYDPAAGKFYTPKTPQKVEAPEPAKSEPPVADNRHSIFGLFRGKK